MQNAYRVASFDRILRPVLRVTLIVDTWTRSFKQKNGAWFKNIRFRVTLSKPPFKIEIEIAIEIVFHPSGQW